MFSHAIETHMIMLFAPSNVHCLILSERSEAIATLKTIAVQLVARGCDFSRRARARRVCFLIRRLYEAV
jgi:hypothetical protein